MKEITIVLPLYKYQLSTSVKRALTILENAKLEINYVSSEIYCRKCGYKGKAEHLEEVDPHFPIIKCPKCGNEFVEIIRGNECIIKSIQVEK